MIYIYVFFLSILSFFLAEKFKPIKFLHILFLLVAILLPSILAGCRDLTVGVDTLIYVVPYFHVAQSSDTYVSFLNALIQNGTPVEPLYALLTYAVSLCTRNVAWLLFIIQFIYILLIYLSSRKLKNYAPVWFFMLIYFLVFFRESLTTARQTMAQVFCLFSFTFLLRRQYLKSILVFLPALGFHVTAFIYLIVYPIFYITNKYSLRTIRIYEIIGALIAFSIVIYLKEVIDFFIFSGILSEKFVGYTSADKFGASFPVAFFTYSVVIFAILLYARRKEKNRIDHYHFFECILLLCIFLSPTSLVSDLAVRGAYYLSFLSIIFIPILLYNNRKIRLSYKKIYPFIVCFLLFYWYMVVVVANLYKTYPYTSKILGID